MLDSDGEKKGLRSKSILSRDEAQSRALAFQPREFPFSPSAAAQDFVRLQAQHENPEFQIDQVVSATSGIATIEKQSLSERVETAALERLKLLQEEAYKQGYDLGRDEGRESAYRERTDELSERLNRLDQIVSSLENLKTALVKQNEASLVGLTYEMAKRLALAEISTHRDVVLKVLEEAAKSAQDEESMTIRLSEADLGFIEESKNLLGKQFEFIKKAKLESVPMMDPGGCVIITNYGQVDATVQTRLEKLWGSVVTLMPKRTDEFGSNHES